MKKRIVFIILTLVIVVVLILVLLNVFSKKEIQLVNIDDLTYDYNALYSADYTLIEGDITSEVSASYNLSDDNTCEYQASYENELGSYKIYSTSCNYEIDRLDITLHMGITTEYTPSSDEDMQVQNEVGMEYVGSFVFDNYSHIEIDDVSYTQEDYQKFVDNDIKEILLDPSNEKKYDRDGESLDQNDNINLDKYEIIDKRKVDNHTESINNIKIISSTSSNDFSTYEEVDYEMLMLRLEDSGTSGLYYIGNPTCMNCQRLTEKLISLQEKYGFKTVYFDITSIGYSGNAYEELQKALIFPYNMFEDTNKTLGDYLGYTPMIFVLSDGVIQDAFIGDVSEDTLLEFLYTNGIVL